MLIAYYRVSTDRQGRSGLGLEAQQDTAAGVARRVRDAIAGSFTEVESGRRRDRPQLVAALARCRELGATLVVAQRDRLSRDTRLRLDRVDSGVPILFGDRPDLPTGTAAGRLILVVMAALAEFESRRIGERVKEALARRRARLAAEGQAEPKRPFTRRHQREAAARWHELDRRAAREFRRAYRPLALGLYQTMTLAGVAAERNARGIPTRAEVDRGSRLLAAEGPRPMKPTRGCPGPVAATTRCDARQGVRPAAGGASRSPGARAGPA